MRKKLAVFVVLALVVSLVGIGCNNGILNPKETIIFVNRSGRNGVNCYVNATFQGTINNGYTLTVDGDFEGNVVLYADGPARWGPKTYYVADGDSFTWTLNP